MKKTFTYLGLALLALSPAAVIAQDQLSNGSFENWEDLDIKDTLDHWFTTAIGVYPFESNVSRIEDGFEGDAVLLESIMDPEGDEVEAGGVILATSLGGDEDFPPGYPYDSEVEDFNAYLRYDIADADTGFVLVILQSAGIPISFGVFPIYGTQETWELFSWDLTDPGIAHDAVTIAFFSSGYSDSPAVDGSWLEVDNVFFENSGDTPDPLPNFSFEDWTTLSIEVSTDWYSLDPVVAGILGFTNISKSTDAAEGDFSLKLDTYDVNVEDEIIPFISNGEFNFETEELEGGSEFTSDPLLFKGQYKFLSETEDTAGIYMIIWNDEGDITEYNHALYPTDEWTEFSIDIDLDFTPDSILAAFFGGNMAGAEMFYDDFRFVYDDVSVNENIPPTFNAYPNPANQLVRLDLAETADIVITDLTGKLVYTEKQVDQYVEIATDEWPNGVYLIQVNSGNQFETARLIVQH